MTEKFKADDVVRSLTGFDEVAIKQWFQDDLVGLGESTMSLRAMVFILNRRDGMKDKDAYKTAMDMPFGEIAELVSPGSGVDAPGEAE